MSNARDAFARVIEQQDDAARRVLGLPPDAALPPSAGATLKASSSAVQNQTPAVQFPTPGEKP